MNFKQYPGTKRRIVFVCLMCFSAFGVQASDINGIAGYTLGDVFDKKLALDTQMSESGKTIYTVKLLKAEKLVDTLTIRVSKKQQIHRISAFSIAMSAAECQTQMNVLRKKIENRIPSLGYYAMDNSELFYQNERTYTLECIKSDDGVHFRQEYSDDNLAVQAE